MLKIYNTLTKKLENFEPVSKDNIVRLYSCGMTVQDSPHIGHIRALITVDIVKRILILNGFKTYSVYNFTDIDDKLIIKMKESGVDYRIISQKNIDKFFDVFKSLNVLDFDVYPRATLHIEEIIDLIERLMDKGYAYKSKDDVYFRVNSFKNYGALSGKNIDELVEGKRIELNENKENPLDFVLWKGVKEDEPFWYSPFGKGRPGWHIECSAMSMKYLGETFDIHTGGQDLIFPHHENEIAQSECATEKKFVKYWIHNGMVNLKGEKMSKSLGNVYGAKELLNRYSPNVIRLFLLKTHYRKDIEFSVERLDESQSAYKRLIENIPKNDEEKIDEKLFFDFIDALNDDFNTPQAIGILFETVNRINLKQNDENILKNTLSKMFSSLGFKMEEKNERKDDLSKTLIEILLDVRDRLKKEKLYDMADSIRERLNENKIIVNDLKDGAVWKIED